MKILAIAGARPNFVKLAPLMKELGRHSEVSTLLVHTGQHYDALMSDQFFKEMEIPAPEVNLRVGSGSHASQTAEVMMRLEPILESQRPDFVLVVGDVNSTLAAAITASKLGLRVAHVEAGLRSFDRTMPEEINRILTDSISDLLFVTEPSGRENLLKEGIPSEKIHFTGNVMIDALEMFRSRWEASTILDRLGVNGGRPYGVLTLHRPSNVDSDDRLAGLMEAVRGLAHRLPIIFPVHPRVKARLAAIGVAQGQNPPSKRSVPSGQIVCLEPLGYLDCIALMSQAHLVLTDSGGIQEETTALGVPCLTLRDTTERPVTVTQGSNRIIGTDPAFIVEESLRTLANPPRSTGRPEMWDGRAAERIVTILLDRAERSGTRQSITEQPPRLVAPR